MEINESNRSQKGINFWLCVGLLVILLVSVASRDITRPFNGLHSWAQASGACVARSHAKYGKKISNYCRRPYSGVNGNYERT